MKRSFLLCFFTAVLSLTSPLFAATAVGTETILDKYFGVNLHMSNCCKGNYADVEKVISELKYIGARRARDWATSDAVLPIWRNINLRTGIKFHASIPQGSPETQRKALVRISEWLKKYPTLIDVIEGSNEPDTAYPMKLGASLADSAELQRSVYEKGKAFNVKVAQLSVGGGWIPPLYEGNYKNFGTPPADYANAHAYMTKASSPMITLKRIGDLASYSTPGKAVDVTEFGTYKKNMDYTLAGAYMHIAPFDAHLLGYAGLFVYALHDDMTNVISFYDENGKNRDFADYWHHTTKLLSDPKGKNLPHKEINITFTEQKPTKNKLLGINNVLMYKSDGSVWIAMYNEQINDTESGSQTIILDREYASAKLYDARTGNIDVDFGKSSKINVILPVNHLYIMHLSNNL